MKRNPRSWKRGNLDEALKPREALVCLTERSYQPPLVSLATTYSPVPYDTVPSALEPFTAEFGMGSGVGAPPVSPGQQRAATNLVLTCPVSMRSTHNALKQREAR